METKLIELLLRMEDKITKLEAIMLRMEPLINEASIIGKALEVDKKELETLTCLN